MAKTPKPGPWKLAIRSTHSKPEQISNIMFFLKRIIISKTAEYTVLPEQPTARYQTCATISTCSYLNWQFKHSDERMQPLSAHKPILLFKMVNLHCLILNALNSFSPYSFPQNPDKVLICSVSVTNSVKRTPKKNIVSCWEWVTVSHLYVLCCTLFGPNETF